MKILAADDDAVSRRLLTLLLERWGYEVIPASDGEKAWEILQQPDAPRIAVLDWMMPGLDGVEICRRVRAAKRDYSYLILLTAKEQKTDIVEGLDAGADDYVTKPYNQAELRSRVSAGERIIRLETALAQKIRELKESNEHVQDLQGMIPICMHCKRIRNEGQTWEKVEDYFHKHAGADFSHALCEECLVKYYGDDDEEGDAEKKEPKHQHSH